MPDLWQFVDNIDAEKQAMLVKRLEDRAQMPKCATIRENYFDKIGLPVTDLSAKLVEVAKDITANLGFKNIEYFQADAQGGDANDKQYDLVLAHTVVSHVADPAAFLREAIRLARPGGQIIVHDGDYGSCIFDTNTPELDRKMPGL